MRLIKKVLSTALAAAMVVSTVTTTPITTPKTVNAASSSNYDYGEALSKSLLFYELQESGDIQDDIRTNWRDDAMMDAGADNGVDLTGGWNDAGDNLKLNLPGTYTSNMLAWSYLEDKDVYTSTGQDKYIKEQIKWENDYLLKCVVSDGIYFQVGADNDHAFWGAAEIVPMASSSYKVTASKPGTAVAASTAAALVSAAMVFEDEDPDYAAECIEKAKFCLNLAIQMDGDSYYNSIAGAYYNSYAYADDVSYAAVWMYKATGDESYLDTAIEWSDKWGKIQGTDDFSYDWTQCWDDRTYGSRILLAEITGDEKFVESTEQYLDFWTTGTSDGTRISYSPKGEAFLNQWGSIRYATTTAFMAYLWAESGSCTSSKEETYLDFAKAQGDYALGSSGQCFVCGYDDPTAPVSPHHRTASGVWTNNLTADPLVNRHDLVGALVGGPVSANDAYTDTRSDYTMNEVAVDYNAGYTGLMAKLYKDYGGTVDPDLNAVEEVGQEFQVTGAINAQDNTNATSFIEMKVTVYNETAWPARKTDNLSYKYFVDISDVLAKGYTADDFTIKTNYNQTGSEVSSLQPWDEENGIYYVNVDMTDAGLYPGGQSECRSELQFRISAPCKWDYTQNPSLEGITSSTSVDAQAIALYEGDELVWGETPDGGSASVKYAPEVSISSPADGASFTDVTAENPVTITADASVQDSTISKVEFYNGSTKIGTDTTAPYTCDFVPANDGTGVAKDYTITAVAYAKNGETTTSDAATISVKMPKLSAPEVTITDTEVSTSYVDGIATATLKVNASADVEDSTVTGVTFYVDGNKITGTVNADGTYSCEYTLDNAEALPVVSTKTVEVYAVAQAANGTTTTTETQDVSVTIPASYKPDVSITSPVEGTEFEIGTETIDVSAAASIVEGAISEVQFYANGTLFATVTDALDGVYNATYTVGAKDKAVKFTVVAVADTNAKTTSDAVSATVLQATPDVPEGFAISVTNSANGSPVSNTISNNINIVNTGSYDIDLSKVEVRYFYTKDSDDAQTIFIDNVAAQMNVSPYYVSLNATTSATVNAMEEATDTADTYLSFTNSSATTLPSGGTYLVSARAAKTNWSNYDQSNDFSYGDAEKIAVYYDGVLVYGMEP